MNDIEKTKLFFIGSEVINTAKNYFGCDSLNTLTGIELDDSNGKEVNDNHTIHWSERLLMGDYMTTELYYSDQAISEITLSLLVDLGWYRVNYYTGGLMKFGKKRGCSFIESDCVTSETIGSDTYTKSLFPNEFCSKIYEGDFKTFGTCSSGRQSMAFCYSPIYNNQISNSDFIRNKLSGSTYGFTKTKLIEYCP